jgi:cephalosporin hydroxylase
LSDQFIYGSELYQLNNFDEFLLTIKDTKWNKFKWKGLTLMKDPFTITTYQQFLQDKKPKTIIEFGTWDGGSALWMSDIIESIGETVSIFTFDNDSSKITSQLTDNKNITFTELDVYNIREYVDNNLQKLKNLPKPILVIEDCHHNLKEILEQCDRFLDSDDYIIVEDTLFVPKHNDMVEFAVDHPNYSVDKYYCDFWGQNCSWNVNSYLKKLS